MQLNMLQGQRILALERFHTRGFPWPHGSWALCRSDTMRRFCNRTFSRLAKGIAMAMFTAFPAGAYQLTLTTTPENNALDSQLRGISLLASEQTSLTQDTDSLLATAKADYGRLIAVLYENGFFAPEISIRIDGKEAAEMSPFTRLSEAHQIAVRIAPGPQFRFGDVSVGPVAPDTPAETALIQGQTARLSAIRSALDGALSDWRAAGHAKAALSDERIVADHPNAQLDVTLEIAPGPRASFGQVSILGDSAVRAGRIARIAGIPLGAVFDPKVLADATARLRRSGAFATVTLSEAADLTADAHLPIDITVTDAKPNRFGLGAELRTDEGLRLSGFWLHRNLLGGAERLRVEGSLDGLTAAETGQDISLAADLTVPAALGPRSDLFLRGQIERLEEPLFVTQHIGLSLGVQQIRNDDLTLQTAVALDRQLVRDGLGARSYSLLTLPSLATQDRRDDRLGPVSGTYLQLDAEPFHDFGTNATGLRTLIEARGYAPLGDSGVTMAGRLKLGSVVGATLAETPPDMLFTSGGSSTVRGHSFQSLSVTTGGAQTGGQSFLGAAAELRVPLREGLGAVAFYDFGLLGADSWPTGTTAQHSGAGVGLRYETGLGPLRLDLAAPVTGTTGSGLQIYLGVGQAF